MTGSLKSIVMLVSAGAKAPSAGEVPATEGGGSAGHRLAADAVLRGAGAPAAKSAALLFVSAQPPALRETALVLLAAGAAPGPSK